MDMYRHIKGLTPYMSIESFRAREGSIPVSLSARIQVAHHDAEHLPGKLRVALGDRRARGVAVRSGDRRQARAAATNEPRRLRRGDASVEGPLADVVA